MSLGQKLVVLEPLGQMVMVHDDPSMARHRLALFTRIPRHFLGAVASLPRHLFAFLARVARHFLSAIARLSCNFFRFVARVLCHLFCAVACVARHFFRNLACLPCLLGHFLRHHLSLVKRMARH